MDNYAARGYHYLMQDNPDSWMPKSNTVPMPQAKIYGASPGNAPIDHTNYEWQV
jgi:hypothetical protein